MEKLIPQPNGVFGVILFACLFLRNVKNLNFVWGRYYSRKKTLRLVGQLTMGGGRTRPESRSARRAPTWLGMRLKVPARWREVERRCGEQEPGLCRDAEPTGDRESIIDFKELAPTRVDVAFLSLEAGNSSRVSVLLS